MSFKLDSYSDLLKDLLAGKLSRRNFLKLILAALSRHSLLNNLMLTRSHSHPPASVNQPLENTCDILPSEPKIGTILGKMIGLLYQHQRINHYYRPEITYSSFIIVDFD